MRITCTATAPEAVLKFVRARQNKLSATADDIYAGIQAELEAGIRAGETTAQLTARVETAFAGVARGRALTIARTEAAAAFNAGQQDAMERTGLKMKRWVCSGLPNVRPAHRAADGQEVPVDEPFEVDGEELDYPGDETGSPENVINCRCIAIAVDPGDAEEILPLNL